MQTPRNLPSISFIVARSFPGHIIGCENRLPWSLKTDLQNFKLVTAKKAVIMGRKTFESIGRPLPGRHNIVMTRGDFPASSNIDIVTSVEDALFSADYYSILNGLDEFFVIGGDQIYRKFKDLYQKIYLTEVFSSSIEGDAYFEDTYDRRQWSTLSEVDYPKGDGDEYPFRITVFERRVKTIRMFDPSKFYFDSAERDLKYSRLKLIYAQDEGALSKCEDRSLDMCQVHALC